MFMQYRKELSPFRSSEIERDSRIEIIHPAPNQSTIVPGQDFYVIGRFRNIRVPENARLVIKLTDNSGRVIRRVETAIRDNVQGIKYDAEGLFTDMSPEAIRHSGMPDLVYDPEDPDSFYDTWNKAWYSEEHFAALVYGGTYDTKHIHQTDQFGERLSPIPEGIFVVSAELHVPNEVIRTSQTLRVQKHTKEIILSRYTSETHSAVLEAFAAENYFSVYMVPYPGIWDTSVFACGWKTDAYIEIPARWEYADSMEYLDDFTHCFNYNISSECVGYRTEIASMLANNANRMNDPEMTRIYYYQNGIPAPYNGLNASAQFAVFSTDEYLVITDAFTALADPCRVQITSVLKPIPSQAIQTAPNRWEISKRILSLQYSVRLTDKIRDENLSFEFSAGSKYITAAGKEEFHLLQSCHRLDLPAAWQGKEVCISVSAIDNCGEIQDTKSVCLVLTRTKPSLVFCDVDGTLIDNSQEITPAFDTLKDLISRNQIPFTIATGRSQFTIREYYNYLGLTMPTLVNNGVNVIDHGQLLWDESFPAHLVREAIQAADSMDMAIFMCFNGKELVYRHNSYIQHEMDEYKRYNHFYIPLDSEWQTLQFERVMITDPQHSGRIDEMLPYLKPYKDELTIIRYDTRHLDVMKKGISKGWGIRRLADRLGLNTAKMMVIGDGANDIEMVNEVGMGVAVGNAVDILKNSADYICQGSNTYGVIEALNLFWK